MTTETTHLDHDHAAATFVDRAAAECSTAILRSHGLVGEHPGIAVHEGDAIAFENDAESSLVRDIAIGAAVGALVGAMAGLTLAWVLSVTFTDSVGIRGVVILTLSVMALGAMLGGYGGIIVAAPDWDEHQAFEYLPLDPGEVMVVVCSHRAPPDVASIMSDGGGRPVSIDA